MELSTKSVFGSPDIQPITQTLEELDFGDADLAKGCSICIYRKMNTADEAMMRSKGYQVRSAFVVWDGESQERKGRFDTNFSRQSMQWEKKTLKMDRIDEFGTSLRQGDHLIGWDLVVGYRHVHFHPKMIEFFCFIFDGIRCQFLALPFG